jgi:hypothetical protein
VARVIYILPAALSPIRIEELELIGLKLKDPEPETNPFKSILFALMVTLELVEIVFEEDISFTVHETAPENIAGVLRVSDELGRLIVSESTTEVVLESPSERFLAENHVSN